MKQNMVVLRRRNVRTDARINTTWFNDEFLIEPTHIANTQPPVSSIIIVVAVVVGSQQIADWHYKQPVITGR